jgi:carbon-monoxide dehydrogenase medium subunit
MIPAAFEYKRASSVDEAVGLLAQNGDARILAGGHSLLPLLKMRLAEAGTLIDIGKIGELKGIDRAADGSVTIGAMTTYAELIADTPFDWVREALEDIGDVQVRNRGTLGGALAHADPAADFPAIALVFDASVVLRSASGEREVPVSDFCTSSFETSIRPGEILTKIKRPPVVAGAGGGYAHLENPASGYSLVGVAALVARSGGSISHARVAVTGACDIAYRAKGVEDALLGSDGSPDAIAAAAAHAVDGKTVNSDIHADREYRSAMAVVYARRAIEAALAAAD